MKSRLSTLVLVLLGMVACSENVEEQPAADQPAVPVAAPDAAKPAETAKPAEVSPADTCGQLTAAAKANDDAKFAALTAGGAEAYAAAGAKEALFAALGAGTCGEAKTEGDKSVVSVATGDVAKEVGLVKGGDGAWKFDAASYLQKYPVEDDKGKKGKKAKGKKAKAKKAKK